jgi:hypothetical protein
VTTAIVVGLGAVVAVLGVLVVGLLRAHAEVLRSLHDLGISPDAADRRLHRASQAVRDDLPPVEGDETTPSWPPAEAGLGPAHDVTGTAPDGAAVHIGVVGAAHDTVLAFLSTGCATCAGFWDAFAMPGAESSAGDATRVVIVTKGPEEESESAVLELAPPQVPTVMSTRAWVDYEIPASPFFLLVDGASSRVVGEGSGQSWDQVLRLLDRSAGDLRAAKRRTRRELLSGARRAQPMAHRISDPSEAAGTAEEVWP